LLYHDYIIEQVVIPLQIAVYGRWGGLWLDWTLLMG